MVIVQPSRLWPLIRLGSWIFIWVILLNISLYELSNHNLLKWLPDRQTGTGFATDNRERIQTAEEQYEDRTVSPDKRLGAIVGISNIREAVDMDILNQRLTRSWRFMGIAGAGAGAFSVVENIRLLQEEKRLKPDLVIVGTAPVQFLDKLLPGKYSVPQQDGMSRFKQAAKNVLWMKARRRDVSVSSERALLEARARLFNAFGVRLATADTRTPWRSMLRVMGSERFPDQAFIDGHVWARSVGAFDMPSYEQSKTAPTMLATALRELAVGGSRVIVVFTPEHSMLRKDEPINLAPYLQHRLREESGISNLLVLDFRAAISDEGFVDLVHLNKVGSERFTPLLIDAIRHQRWTSAPLMSQTG